MPANGAAVALSVLRALVAARAERRAAAALPRDGGRHVPALRCERRGRKRAHFRTAGGYPVGARTVAELYGRGEIAREEAEQLLAFCNNSGPGFFLGVCGTAVFGSARAGMYLYLIHVGAALVTGVLLRRDLGSAASEGPFRGSARPFDLAAALPAAVQGSFAAVGSVSAFVIFFMVLLRLLSLVPALAALPPLPRAALFGFVEMTNGVNALPATRTGFVLCAAIMNWGGLSVQAQTRALLAGSACPRGGV